jgi:hypothetical protein
MAQAAARLERFKLAQAAIAEHLHLENSGQDLDIRHRKELAGSTLEQHRAAKRWFIEYLQHQTPLLDPQRFFKPDHAPPDRVLLKQYAIFMAQSRVGRISDTIAVRTLTNYMRLLFTVLSIDRDYALDRNLQLDVQAYIDNDMVKEYHLSREQWKKPVAHSEDLTYLLSVLYTPQFIGTFFDMRQLLNFTLFLNIMVDAGCRGGDIAWDRKTQSGTCLLWEDVKFYAFWDASIDAVDIRANITFRHLKGMKLDPSHYKTVPLSLFQTDMVQEDTLRLILIMALMDNVFQADIRTWSDLMLVPSSLTGRLIPLKENIRSIPLLRKVDNVTYALTDRAEQLREMQNLTRRLGRAAGLEDRLTAYCLRRGVAYTLATKTSADNRRFLMGHKTASKIYSEYASRVATVDLAALYRNREPRPILQMSSMLLNSSVEAPRMISNEGRAQAKLNASYLASRSIYVALREDLLLEHGTLAAASRTTDSKYAEFQVAYNKQSSALQSASKKIYRQEYSDFFQFKDQITDRPTPISIATSPSASHKLASPISSTSSRVEDVCKELCYNSQESPMWIGESCGKDSSRLALDEREEVTSVDPRISLSTHAVLEDGLEDIIVKDEFRDIDPILLGMSAYGRLFEGQEGLVTLVGNEAKDSNNFPDLIITTEPVQSHDHDHPPIRLHGVSKRDQTLINAYESASERMTGENPTIYPQENYGADRDFVDPYLCDQILSVLGSDASENVLATTLGRFFGIVHPIDRFYPGQEPCSGTYRCLFCDESLTKFRHAALHVSRCAEIGAIDQACSIYDLVFPFDQPCTFTHVRKVNGDLELVECGKTFSDRQGFGDHNRSHLLGNNQMVRDASGKLVPTCFHTSCAVLPAAGQGRMRHGIIFQSREERLVHMRTQHQLVLTVAPKPIFCEFCYEYVLPHDADAHFELHVDDIGSVVKDTGYSGVIGLGRCLRPRLCIFCYHDGSLSASVRFNTHGGNRTTWIEHINAHLTSVRQATPCPAFPILCTMSEPMESVKMRDHLARVHGIIIEDQKKRKFRAALAPLSPNKASRSSESGHMKKYRRALFDTALGENEG